MTEVKGINTGMQLFSFGLRRTPELEAERLNQVRDSLANVAQALAGEGEASTLAAEEDGDLSENPPADTSDDSSTDLAPTRGEVV